MKPKNLILLALALCACIPIASASTWYVDDDGGADYTSIQDAINNANSGDTIEVQSGTYYENVNVNKQVILRGVDTGAGKPVVDAGGMGDAITLSADGITLEGFTDPPIGIVPPFPFAGIKVTSNNNTLTDNNVSNNDWGIYLYGSNNTLSNNNASNNENGIYLVGSNNNTLSNNTANLNNNYGIYLWYSSNNTLYNNTANLNNNYGIYLYNSSSNTLENNLANLNTWHGIHLFSSSNYNTINNNTASNNYGEGIFLYESSSNTLENNNASNNGYGICLQYSNYNTLYNNTANSNNNYGIYLEGSNNTFYNNNASNNGNSGISLYYSSTNKIYLNNFINNTNNVYFYTSTNIWNSPEKITYTYNSKSYTNYLGNYWSDYTGSDANNDGIGDTAYGGIDKYPLMEHFENYIGVTPIPNKPPIASFTYSPENPEVNQEITFDASSSYDPDGSITKYEWDFGDKNTKEGKIVTHSYSKEGSYQVKLRVKDEKGDWSEMRREVTVFKPFTFVQITDVHVGGLDIFSIRDSIKKFSDTLQKIRILNSKPAFILVTGDDVEWNDIAFLSAFKSILFSYYMQEKRDKFDIPVYFVPGNHDRRNLNPLVDDNLANYHEYIRPPWIPDIPDPSVFKLHTLIPPDNYRFEHNDYLFIGLDSGEDILTYPPKGSGLSNEQMDQLNSLDITKPKIIFMHHPAINDKNEQTISNNQEEFIDYCKENNVALVLTGHTHVDKIFDANGNKIIPSYFIIEKSPSDPFDIINFGILTSTIGELPYKPPFFLQTRSATKDEKGNPHGFRIIKIDAYTISTATEKTREISKKTVSVTGQVNLHVYDSHGKHTGFGSLDVNIPDSFYTGNYNGTLSSTMQTMQTDINESFNMTIINQTSDSLTTISYNNISITKSTTAEVILNRTSPNLTMYIDYNGDNVTDEEKSPDTIETDYAPNATIILPVNNSVYIYGEEIVFNGTGKDLEDGILKNSSLLWSSSINGYIGMGERFNTSNLSAGTHHIELRVNDSSGQIDLKNVTIKVIAPDLMINTSNISFSNPNPIDGENITINATIYNIGDYDAKDINVIFYDGDPINGTHIWENQTIASINASENKTVSVFWNTTGEGGDNIIWVVVDPSNSIKESNEINNHAKKSIFVEASNLLHILQAKTDKVVYLEGEEVLISCVVQNATYNISANVSADIEKPDGIIDKLNLSEGLIGNYNGTFTNTSLSGTYKITIHANRTGFIDDNESLSFEILDTIPLSSITNLTSINGSTWINWTWDNPRDPDFYHTLIYLNGAWKTATSNNYYNATGLTSDTEYTILTHTVDKVGNINSTWVNQTAKTITVSILCGDVAPYPDSNGIVDMGM